MDYRRRVRKALVDSLKAQFNLNLATKSADYGVPPFVIDFEPCSRNFVQAQIDALSFSVSTAAVEPPALVVYTSEAVDEKRQTNTNFSGFLAAHADFYLQYRALRDRGHIGNEISQSVVDYEPEIIADCVEDAFLESIRSAQARDVMIAARVTTTEYRADRDPIIFFGDGMLQRVAITLGYNVHV